MENANRFRAKLESGQIPLGCGVTFSDPTVTELISHTLDFAFIDMEHNAHSPGNGSGSHHGDKG